MWKCQYCEKTNFDDQPICPYCNAPNPAGKNYKSASAAGPASQPQQGGRTTPAQDWETRYQQNNSSRRNRTGKLSSILKYSIIGVSALLVLFIVTMIIQGLSSNDKTADAPQKTSEGLKNLTITSTAKETPVVTTAPTPTPEPTNAPVTVEAAVDIYLDFGETYQCDTDDFILPYDIDNEDVVWSCSDNEEGTTCNRSGLITAGTIQVDTELKFNEAVTVSGTTSNGSILSYTVYTGDGKTYTFDWSNSSRSMRGYLSGYVIVADKMITQCDGFSIYYEYELKHGKLDANAWSVWVREDGTSWVRVQDIDLQNEVGDVFDITFDRPISFNEIWIMPETYSPEFSFTSAFYIGYLVFD